MPVAVPLGIGFLVIALGVLAITRVVWNMLSHLEKAVYMVLVIILLYVSASFFYTAAFSNRLEALSRQTEAAFYCLEWRLGKAQQNRGWTTK